MCLFAVGATTTTRRLTGDHQSSMPLYENFVPTCPDLNLPARATACQPVCAQWRDMLMESSFVRLSSPESTLLQYSDPPLYPSLHDSLLEGSDGSCLVLDGLSWFVMSCCPITAVSSLRCAGAARRADDSPCLPPAAATPAVLHHHFSSCQPESFALDTSLPEPEQPCQQASPIHMLSYNPSCHCHFLRCY